MISTVKDCNVGNESEVDIFLEIPIIFYDPTDIGNLISGSSALSKSSLNIWKFLVQYFLTAENTKNMWQEHTE